MNVLSLFSGIGGLDLGLQRAGMTIAGQVEIDPWCRKVLAKHWPEVPRHDDVRTAAQWWGSRRAPDVVCGGFPCQPVSVAGRGLAQADPRWLWPAMAGIIRALRPRFVLVENVPGLLGRGMGDVLGDLAASGYDAEWDCLSAADFGAVHLRKRIWIVAYSAGARCASRPRGTSGPAWLDARRPRSDGQGSDVADTDRGRCEIIRLAEPAGQQSSSRRQPDRCGTNRQLDDTAALADASSARPSDRRSASRWRPGETRWVEPERLGWWAAEPDVGRVAHGIPGRVDRLRGLGNAVVPQVAEHIGRMIMEAA